MALRSSAQLRSWLSRGMRNGNLKSSFSTSARHADSGHESSFKIWPVKGVYAPVYVAVGLIAMSVGFGINTASHQIKWAPGVRVKKSKRETVPEVVEPEVVEPEAVAEESGNFINNSFFRKVAHVQDSDRQDVMPNPISGDVYAKQNRPRIETLKDVGVETPKEASPYKQHHRS